MSNFVEQIYYFPQQKIKRTHLWVQVSKHFDFFSRLTKESGM